MNNSNKANNNSTSVKGKGENTKVNQPDKDTDNSGTAAANHVNLSPTESTNKFGNSEDSQQNKSPGGKPRQQKPERTSRFGPSITPIADQNPANQNLKFPKFLPGSNNAGGGLLPLPPPETKLTLANSFYATKQQATRRGTDMETDSLGRMRRRR